MGDRNLKELLKWSLANSTPPSNSISNGKSSATAAAATATSIAAKSDAPTTSATSESNARSLNPDALASLFGGPSEADLMLASMATITSPEVPLDQKLIAFDNFEQLIESLDNADLLSKLGLWTPLLEQLAQEDPEIRIMAAWCIGTAVQNNVQCQERLLAVGGVERLVAMACDVGERRDVRKKSVYALSSAVRNYQPAMDVATKEMGKIGRHTGGGIDAADMDAVDAIVGKLREEISKE